jgi:hypothetical protein
MLSLRNICNINTLHKGDGYDNNNNNNNTVGDTAGSREVPGRKPVTRDRNDNFIFIIIIIKHFASDECYLLRKEKTTTLDP